MSSNEAKILLALFFYLFITFFLQVIHMQRMAIVIHNKHSLAMRSIVGVILCVFSAFRLVFFFLSFTVVYQMTLLLLLFLSFTCTHTAGWEGGKWTSESD